MSAETDSLVKRYKAHVGEFAFMNDYYKTKDHWDWLRFWSGPTWGDTPPQRLFGSWVKPDGDAT